MLVAGLLEKVTTLMPSFRSLHFLVLLVACGGTSLDAALTTTVEPDTLPNVAPFATTRTFDAERNTARRTPSAILNVYDGE